MKFEIVPVKSKNENTWVHAMIGTITGYEIEEILLHLPESKRIRTNQIKETIESLGYSCSKRFVKFDPDCKNPCIIRCVKKMDENGKESSSWYPFPYYDRIVYYSDGYSRTLDNFMNYHNNLRITTMLEVYL